MFIRFFLVGSIYLYFNDFRRGFIYLEEVLIICFRKLGYYLFSFLLGLGYCVVFSMF